LKPGSDEHSLSEAIVVMAHKLGLKVIAEGVETHHQELLLKRMNCDYCQGYLYTKPLPVTEFEGLYLNKAYVKNIR
jgi:EAL domain-containing protein (putative c-di-GMP-specific phosphodiesterase class I)